jgi:hypothetical protein
VADPAAVTRGLKAGAVLRALDISIPPTKDGYLTNWSEDLGYADFYNLAFRLFGVSAVSTHWLYISVLITGRCPAVRCGGAGKRCSGARHADLCGAGGGQPRGAKEPATGEFHRMPAWSAPAARRCF